MGQLTHVPRHTFVSYFMINGGSILTLQRILGRQDLKTTYDMRTLLQITWTRLECSTQ